MRLDAGARIGHYEVVSLIGTGGMGEVYKARDTRLRRTVAIKILHTPSADLRQRFDREARVVAALQHPHICTLIDIGEHEGVDYIVMEFLDGQPLTCPQPLGKLVEYGVQIADAVDAVHRRGVTHRDLKPDNILITTHGAKILDFGIAKAVSQETATVTQTGMAIGTPAYMAPEQWRGLADHRTDIYALGCVLYEMATGERASEKPLHPPRLEFIVRGCLATEPDDRWQSARDVARLLKTVSERELPASAPSPSRRWLWPAITGFAAVAGALAGWSLTPTGSPDILQLSLAPPPASSFLVGRNREGGFAISPDGSMLAFVASSEGRTLLWVRRFDSFDARPLAGTDGAYTPFWSPDSKWLGYYTPEKLMTIAAVGGEPKTICKTDPRSAGGAWGLDGVLLVTGVPGGINRVSATGSALVPVVAGSWPQFLPDRKRFLFQQENGVWVASVDASEQPRQLVQAPALKPVFSRGHLLFIRGRTLMAQRFDPATLTVSGEAFAVIEPLTTPDPVANPGDFSAASDGRLVYGTGGSLSKLIWRDRRGKVLGELASGAEFATPRISPDGKRVAFSRLDRDNMDIWVATVDRPPAIQLTFDPKQDRYPIWSPDGAAITFASGEPRQSDLYSMPSDGTAAAERLTSTPSPQHAMDWSSDGKYLSFTRNVKGTDLMILPKDGSEYIFLQTDISEAHSQFSPGSPPRWIAYSADDNGPREIYVKRFVPGQSAGSARRQISTGGGTMPRWRGDGTELYYWALNGKIMAVSVDGTGPAFQASTPVVLFQVQPPTLRTNDISFDVTPDGQRFLLVEPVERVQSQPLTFITDWLAATRRPSN